MKAITAANWLRLLARCCRRRRHWLDLQCSRTTAYLRTGFVRVTATAVLFAPLAACIAGVRGGAYGLLGNDATLQQPVPVSVRSISTAPRSASASFTLARALRWLGSLLGTRHRRRQQPRAVSLTATSRSQHDRIWPGHTGEADRGRRGAHLRAFAIRTGSPHRWKLVGQSGRQGNNDVNEVVAVPLPAADEIVAGEYHTCARTGGTVWCWGQNTSGQLGNSSTSNNYNPVQAYAITSAIAIAAGRSHSCALLAAGGVLINSTVSCWGDNGTGQLGYGVSGGINPPTNVVSLSSASATPSGIAAGNQHSCARLTDATVQCWGNNLNGALATARRLVPVSRSTWPTCHRRSAGSMPPPPA